jgi:hypothetical protein
MRLVTTVLGPPLYLVVRGPAFDSRRYQIFCVAVGLERGPLMRINEELLESKVAAPIYKTQINYHKRSAALTKRHPPIRKSWH